MLGKIIEINKIWIPFGVRKDDYKQYYYLGIRLDDKSFKKRCNWASDQNKVSRAEKFEMEVLMDC